jgi:hypothetical protein
MDLTFLDFKHTSPAAPFGRLVLEQTQILLKLFGNKFPIGFIESMSVYIKIQSRTLDPFGFRANHYHWSCASLNIQQKQQRDEQN